jgi:hypothetical protein
VCNRKLLGLLLIVGGTVTACHGLSPKPVPLSLPPPVTIADGAVTVTLPASVPVTLPPPAVLTLPPPPALSNSNSYVNSDGQTVHSPAYSTNGQVPMGATAQCRDGTYSFSLHRSGTCAYHGGVARWLTG